MKINRNNFRGLWTNSSLVDPSLSRIDPTRIGLVMPNPSGEWGIADVFRLSDYEQRFDFLYCPTEHDPLSLEDLGSRYFAGTSDLKPLVSYDFDSPTNFYRYAETPNPAITIYNGEVGDFQSRLIRHHQALLALQFKLDCFELLDDSRLIDTVYELSFGKIRLDPSKYFDVRSPKGNSARIWAMRYLWNWISDGVSARNSHSRTNLPDLDPAGLDDVFALADIYAAISSFIPKSLFDEAQQAYSKGKSARRSYKGSRTTVEAAKILAAGAYEAGINSYLDAYFQGVPVSDLVA